MEVDVHDEAAITIAVVDTASLVEDIAVIADAIVVIYIITVTGG